MITREELYHLMWSVPTRHAAATLGVSDAYVIRVCRALDVPKPPRGWWAKRQSGMAVAQPPLPPPRPGHPVDWARGRATSTWTSVGVFNRWKASMPSVADGVHPLLAFSGRIEAFGAPVPGGTCRDPRLRTAIDLTATVGTFGTGLRLANALFLELARRGHAVKVQEDHDAIRPIIDLWEQAPSHYRAGNFHVRTPRMPTIVTIGSQPLGLAIVETHTERKMRYLGHGQYEPAEYLENGRSGPVAGITWVEWQMRPTGVLRLVAYSPRPSNPWRNEWRLVKSARPADIARIVSDLERSAGTLARARDSP